MFSSVQTETVIVGSGPGGATAARELASLGRKVIIVEKGDSRPRPVLYHDHPNLLVKGTKLFKKTLGIQPFSPAISVRTWIGVGGTSMVSSANAVRGWQRELGSLGIDLADEFAWLEKAYRISPFPEYLIGPGAFKTWKAAESLGIAMEPIPKLIDIEQCDGCGLCNHRCPKNAKWTAEHDIQKAEKQGARLLKGTAVSRVTHSGGTATGVVARAPDGEEIRIEADNVILAAGAVGTPIILQNSGIDSAGHQFFCHPFFSIFGPIPGHDLGREPRSICSKQFLEEDGFLLANDIMRQPGHSSGKGELAIMVKAKDDIEGRVLPTGSIHKDYSADVLEKAKKSIQWSTEILAKAGVPRRKIKVVYHAALHPGGTAGIGRVVDSDLETELKNCYVADASVLPSPTGIPPILTIMALSRRLAKKLAQKRDRVEQGEGE